MNIVNKIKFTIKSLYQNNIFKYKIYMMNSIKINIYIQITIIIQIMIEAQNNCKCE